MRHISTFKLFESKDETGGLWYHGDRDKTDFTDRKMDAEDFRFNRNAVGPGIYFTRLEWQAKGYAIDGNPGGGYLYTCEIDVDPKRLMHDDTRIDRAKLLKFIKMAPDKDLLLNYGMNIPDATQNALKLNAESSDNMHDAIMGLYNDLYQRDSRLFGKTMVALGYDAMLHKLPEVDHLIVWNTGKIKIVKEEKVS